MTIRLFALCCGLVFLTGCGSSWVKPGASRQEFAEDRSACFQEAERPSGPLYGNPFTGFFEHGSYTDSHRFNACMVEHGWSQKDS